MAGIEAGRRLPTVPQVQFAGAATYQWQVRQEHWRYVTGTYHHIGSRFTQVGDEDLGTLDLLSFGANTIGAPLTASTFIYDPKCRRTTSSTFEPASVATRGTSPCF